MSTPAQIPPAPSATRKPPSTIFDVIGVLRRRLWLIALLTLVGGIAAFAFTMTQGKVYEADAVTLVQRQSLAKSLNNIVDPGAQVNEGPRVLEAQAQLAKSPEVADATLKAVPGTGLTVNELLASVTVTPDVNGDLLDFALTNSDGDTAVKLINAYVDQYVIYSSKVAKASAVEAYAEVKRQLKKLSDAGERDSASYQRLAANQDSLRSIISLSTPTAQVISKATDFTKTKPKTMIALVLGLFLGLAIGIGMAFLLDALDGRVRTPEAIADALGLPLLAVLPTGRRASPTDGRHDPETEEACRVLLAALSGASRSSSGSLLVTGASNPATYSSIAANLAHTSARSGRDTVLVDLGFRNGSLTRLMGVKDRLGVTDVLLGGASLAEASLPIPTGTGDTAELAGRLRFLPVGGSATGTSDLIGSLAVRELLDKLTGGDTLVIVDTGSTIANSEAISAADIVDNVLFVAATDSAEYELLADARRRLDLANARPIGAAVIDVADAARS